ncbi:MULTISPECIES: hypothetical protein [unclassified Acidiphilium]|uniref:hypothetical protein n=1 Tax=unclassified Acidiphilium TaxID=2617493 RepID=UPI000BCA4CEF|nr:MULTISPECIES: hypothetical protein [unclassified Acidiphilium]OYV57459.1 MAG: hypothetical protein B7Z76_01405 [Acidiphilium sp. 20-67-58]HQT59674.1 hypothetical protein [Acidiphilium sp.]
MTRPVKSVVEIRVADVEDSTTRMQDAARALRLFLTNLPAAPDEYRLRSLRWLVDAVETEADVLRDNWQKFCDDAGMNSGEQAA